MTRWTFGMFLNIFSRYFRTIRKLRRDGFVVVSRALCRLTDTFFSILLSSMFLCACCRWCEVAHDGCLKIMWTQSNILYFPSSCIYVLVEPSILTVVDVVFVLMPNWGIRCAWTRWICRVSSRLDSNYIQIIIKLLDMEQM